MTLMTHIPLAEGGWDTISDLVVMLVVIAIAAIGGIVKKVQETQAAKRANQAKQGLGERSDATSPEQPKQQESAKVHSAGQALELLRRRRNQATRRREHRSLYEHQPTPQPQASAPAQQSQPLIDLVDLHEVPPPPPDRLAVEAARKRRRAHLEAQKRKARTQLRPAAEVTDRADAGPTAAEMTGTALSDPNALRRAIIYHEIFSAPKALRDQAEMWDV